MSLQPHPDDQPDSSRGQAVEITDNHMRVFRLVKDFGGLPLSGLDVFHELGIGERRARTILGELAELSLLNTKLGPSNTRLYFVQEALCATPKHRPRSAAVPSPAAPAPHQQG